MATLQKVRQFCEIETAFSPSSIRALIFNEETNGLKKSGAIVRIGRKVLINPVKFFQWVEEKNKGVK